MQFPTSTMKDGKKFCDYNLQKTENLAQDSILQRVETIIHVSIKSTATSVWSSQRILLVQDRKSVV